MFELTLRALVTAMTLMLPEMPTSLRDLPRGKKHEISHIYALIYKKMERKLRKAVEEATEELNELYTEAMKENSTPTE